MEARADYYATLGVDPMADTAAIRLAYRRLMRAYHPDAGLCADSGARARALNEAYACLRDPARRAAYDDRSSGPHRAPVAPPFRTRPAFQPGWHARHADLLNEGPPLLKRWKVLSLGLAALLTVLTFAITSAVGPMPPPPASTTHSL